MSSACRPWLTSLPNCYWPFLELVVTASCNTSMLAYGGLGAWFPSTPRLHSNQDSRTMSAIAFLVTHHMF